MSNNYTNEDKPIDILSEAEQVIENYEEQVGKVNILIAGNTGVGKSTLINAMFNDETIAKIGVGRPVTDEIGVKEKDGIPISFIDTKGFELEKYNEILNELKLYIENCNNYNDINKQIHVAWICISAMSSRNEDAEINLVEMLSNLNIPTIIVITKSMDMEEENELKACVEKTCPRAKDIVIVRAKEYNIKGTILKPKNLEELAKITNKHLPEAIQEAFIRVQKVSLSLKITKSWGIVATAVAMAGTAGAVPIPISDYPIIIGIEISMLGSISYIFGINLNKHVLANIIKYLFGVSGNILLRKTLITSLLKFIPGLNIVAAVISGITAASLTGTLGGMYIITLTDLYNKYGEIPNEKELENAIKNIKKNGLSDDQNKYIEESLNIYKTNQFINVEIPTSDVEFDPYDFSTIENSINKFKNDLGKFNILIAGKTGVGKSTLINSIFQEKLAETGCGKPITKKTTEITKEGMPISIFDTKGLEIEEYNSIINSLEDFIDERQKRINIHEHIHVAWVCIAENSSRFEDAETTLIEMLLRYNIPIIIVITKALYDENFIEVVKQLCPNVTDFVRVISETYTISNKEIEPMNLDLLVKMTNNVLPNGIKNAFISSQKVLLNLKNEASNKINNEYINKGVMYFMGKLFLPFKDSSYIIKLEINMLISISGVFGLEFKTTYIEKVVKTIFGDNNKLGVKGFISNSLKLIPGANIIGSYWSSKYVCEILRVVGNIYINALCTSFSRNDGERPTDDEIISAIKEEQQKLKNSNK